MESAGAQPTRELASETPHSLPSTDWRRWCELGLIILLTIVPLILIAVSWLLNAPAGVSSIPIFRFVSGFLQQISGLLLLVYVLGRQGRSLRDIGFGFRWTDLLKALGLAIAAIVLSAVFSVIVRHSTVRLTGQAADIRDPRVIFAGASPTLLLIYSAFSSLFEETIVRGYVTTELIGLACPVWLATLASILLQSSYHIYYGLGGAMVVAGVFTVFGLYFAKSRRLLPVILGHLFVDMLAVVPNYFH